VLSGGLEIRNWKAEQVNGRTLWSARVPTSSGTNVFFRELWVNGKRATRARMPNHGYFAVKGLPDATPSWEQGQSRFRFNTNDIQPWPSVTNAEVIVMSRWVESRLPIQSVDEQEHIVTFGKKSVFQIDARDPYYIENALEIVDDPGEWYLDAAGATIYYFPRPGEKIEATLAVFPTIPRVMVVDGDPAATQFVQNVTISGLTFSHAEWDFTDQPSPAGKRKKVFKSDVSGFPQAAVGVAAAIQGQGLHDCVFTNCRFIGLGGYALELGAGCVSNVISRCDFGELGAGGIRIGTGAVPASTATETRGNEIVNCAIHDGGLLFPSAVGLWIGQSSGNHIAHTDIHDFYYTGISVGWTWGYGPSAATNNVIEFNRVHHIGVKSDGDGPILSDMGGIYTLGRQPGTRIINNVWHDIAGLHYGGWGIYFDEGSSGILAQSNIVYRTTHGGFHQHYGETNVLRNNIFAFARDSQLQRTRPEPHTSFSFETNIVYFATGNVCSGDWAGGRFDMDWNVIFDARTHASPASLNFAGRSLSEWQKGGHDQHSVFIDPLFENTAACDFRLKHGSPALKLGFRPIDMRSAGVQRR
jgi:hypothetical protein